MFINFVNLDLVFFLFVVFIDKEEEVEQLDRNEEGEWLTNFYFINKEEDLEGGRRLQEQEQGRRRRGRRRQLEDIKVRQTNRFK